MQISVKTFAQTREVCEEPQLSLTLNEGANVAEAIALLGKRSEKWALALDAKVLTACNQQLCDQDTVLRSGDELALFPPVTGG